MFIISWVLFIRDLAESTAPIIFPDDLIELLSIFDKDSIFLSIEGRNVPILCLLSSKIPAKFLISDLFSGMKSV